MNPSPPGASTTLASPRTCMICSSGWPWTVCSTSERIAVSTVDSSERKSATAQTEVSVLPIYRHMPNWLTSLKTLKEHSFDVTGLFPVSQDPALRVVEFDCVAVNARFNRNAAPPR